MSERHVLDELSAYLDGESADPERIERHLQRCASCARRYMELSKLSANLKAMPAPEVHPAFKTRVMAEVAAAGPVRKRLSWRWAAGTAIVALAVVAGAWFGLAPHGMDGRPAEAKVDLFSAEGEALLVAELEERLAESETGYSWAPQSYMGEDELSDDLWLDTLAETDLFDEFAVAVSTDNDLDSLLAALGDDGLDTFRELLTEYATEDWTS